MYDGMYICTGTMFMPSAHGGQKRASGAWMESRVVVSHHVCPLQEQHMLSTAEPHLQPLTERSKENAGLWQSCLLGIF